MKNGDYQKMSDHDLLVTLHTKADLQTEFFNKTIDELKKEDKQLHGRITKSNDRTDKKVGEVHNRVDKIKIIAVGSGGLGGLIAGLIAWFSSLGGK